MAQRGRPKSEGELKESSVRIRPALKAKLEQAAAEEGTSIAAELEARLNDTFEMPPARAPTRELLQKIALAVKEVEAESGKHWDKDLTTWAMLREVAANGPITERIPHPDEAAARNLVAQNAELVELQAERRTVAKMLRDFGIEPDPHPSLGSAWAGNEPQDRTAAREAIKQMEGMPESARATLLSQLERLDELDAEIADLHRQVTKAMVPYVKARIDARKRLYRTQGIPDLPTWLTAPVSLDESPSRRGMFAGR